MPAELGSQAVLRPGTTAGPRPRTGPATPSVSEGTGPVSGARCAERLEVADRLTAGDQDQSQVDQELAAVVQRAGTPAHRRREPGPQPGPLGQQPHRQQPGVGDQPLVIANKFQASSP